MGTGRLERIYQEFRDQVEFFYIYIREAHPVDGWYLGDGIPGTAMKVARLKAATDVQDPKILKERRGVAQRCTVELELKIPVLVDGMDDLVNKAYAAWPTRLYLVGVDGIIVYMGGPGPFGFRPNHLRKAIVSYLVTGKA
jgi:hypothetical protein